MIIRFSKSNMWCQELFMDTYVTDITILFFSNCKTSVKAAGVVLGIALLDHIIFNRSGYYSFLEAGRL